MQYAVSLRVQPLARSVVSNGGLTLHNGRTGALQENIDPARVKDNRVLVGTRDPAQDLKVVIADVPMARKGKNRDEELVGAELVLTAHHEFFDSLPEEFFWRWVKTNVKFLQQKYDGRDNKGLLVNAILHMDEKAPHIHAVIAPVIEKARRNPVTKEMMPAKRQLNYSEIFMDRNEVLWQAKKEGRSHLDTKLGRLQTEYAEAMKIFGLVRGRESVRTYENVKHVSPKEFQIRQRIDKLTETRAKLEAAEHCAVSKISGLNAKFTEAVDGLKAEYAKVKAPLNADLSKLRDQTAETQGELDTLEAKLHETKAELHEVGQKLVKEKAVYEQALKIVRRNHVQLEGQKFAEEMAVLRGRHLEQQHLEREAAKQRQPAHHSMGV